MIVLFDATAVKSNRTTQATQARRPFGAGLLAYTPTYRSDHTASEYREYLEMMAEDDRLERKAREEAAREYDEIMEDMYRRRLGEDRACAGTVC